MLHPRDYLSWSQLTLWERSPKTYEARYFRGEKFTSRAMAFGKTMADALENEDETGDAVLDLVISKLPKLELMDKEFSAEIPGNDFVVPIVFRPDTAKKDLSAFKEYKTGVDKWDKKKVRENGQITFYAMGAWLLKKKIPTDLELVHALTRMDEAGRPEATGDVFRHPTERTMQDILLMIKRCRKAWQEIGEAYTSAAL